MGDVHLSHGESFSADLQHKNGRRGSETNGKERREGKKEARKEGSHETICFVVDVYHDYISDPYLLAPVHNVSWLSE